MPSGVSCCTAELVTSIDTSLPILLSTLCTFSFCTSSPVSTFNMNFPDLLPAFFKAKNLSTYAPKILPPATHSSFLYAMQLPQLLVYSASLKETPSNRAVCRSRLVTYTNSWFDLSIGCSTSSGCDDSMMTR